MMNQTPRFDVCLLIALKPHLSLTPCDAHLRKLMGSLGAPHFGPGGIFKPSSCCPHVGSLTLTPLTPTIIDLSQSLFLTLSSHYGPLYGYSITYICNRLLIPRVTSSLSQTTIFLLDKLTERKFFPTFHWVQNMHLVSWGRCYHILSSKLLWIHFLGEYYKAGLIMLENLSLLNCFLPTYFNIYQVLSLYKELNTNIFKTLSTFKAFVISFCLGCLT